MTAVSEDEWRSYSFLFADYFIELARHWSRIQTFRYKKSPLQEKEIEQLSVIYGQPNSAYRRLFQPDENNKQVYLPVLNFYMSDARRIRERQNPYASWTQYDGQGGAYRHRAGQVYELTYTCSLWTNDNKTRDDVMSQILRDFNTSLNLRHFPIDGDPKFVWFSWSMPENFSDTTDLELIPEKSTVKFRRTDFTLTGEAVVPLDSKYSKAITNIQVDTNVMEMFDGETKTQYKVELLPTSTLENPEFVVTNSYENI